MQDVDIAAGLFQCLSSGFEDVLRRETHVGASAGLHGLLREGTDIAVLAAVAVVPEMAIAIRPEIEPLRPGETGDPPHRLAGGSELVEEIVLGPEFHFVDDLLAIDDHGATVEMIDDVGVFGPRVRPGNHRRAVPEQNRVGEHDLAEVARNAEHLPDTHLVFVTIERCQGAFRIAQRTPLDSRPLPLRRQAARRAAGIALGQARGPGRRAPDRSHDDDHVLAAETIDQHAARQGEQREADVEHARHETDARVRQAELLFHARHDGADQEAIGMIDGKNEEDDGEPETSIPHGRSGGL